MARDVVCYKSKNANTELRTYYHMTLFLQASKIFIFIGLFFFPLHVKYPSASDFQAVVTRNAI